MAETIKSKRPDTTDMYEFIWISDSGLPIECFFNYAPPDPDDEVFPSARPVIQGCSLGMRSSVAHTT